MIKLTNLLSLLIIKIRGLFLKKKLSNENSQVKLHSPFFKITIVKKKGAIFQVNGKLEFGNDFGQTNRTFINLEENASLIIDGDFWIGNGVRIFVGKNGLLKIGGREKESRSGITSNSAIFAYKKVEIGKDFLSAWNVFITDCDWHQLECDGKSQIQSDVIIGNHVWVAHNCSILKGTQIGNGSIVGSHSLLNGKVYPANSLVAGIPAKVLKKNCRWSHELQKD